MATKAGAQFKDFTNKALNHDNKTDRAAFLQRRIYFQATETVEQAEEMWIEMKDKYDADEKVQKEDSETLRL